MEMIVAGELSRFILAPGPVDVGARPGEVSQGREEDESGHAGNGEPGSSGRPKSANEANPGVT
jgi:hypothetical protein